MANEKNVKQEDKKIFVERGTYEKNGKTYYNYFIKGTVRGVDVKVEVIPPDFGGYTVLDIVYGKEMAAELVLKPYEMKDAASGKVIKGNTYTVMSADENGEIYECKIKPSRDSDKTLLGMLLR